MYLCGEKQLFYYIEYINLYFSDSPLPSSREIAGYSFVLLPTRFLPNSDGNTANFI